MVAAYRVAPRWMSTVASAGMLLAGALHLAVAVEHWSHAPAHALFFIGTGLVQIVWSLAFWRSASPPLQKVGFLLAAVLLLLWALTRVAPVPFEPGPEEVDAAGLATKACEAVCAAALVLMLVASAGPQTSGRSWRTVLGLTFVSLLLTGLTYGVARAAEPFLPGLKAEEAAPHEHPPAEPASQAPPATDDRQHVP
ncbi:MAG: hypothetical protein A2Y93_00265 [Chloroflexi bacterium RBG_13_68_17]|nr:MAG: hypothetical protein A2Y93_00265 [Chloroflexi bacterium RBG_13_68_17]